MDAAFKQLVQRWFPGGLWDTKHLARELLGIFEGRNHLGDLHQQLVQPSDNPSLMALLQARVLKRLAALKYVFTACPCTGSEQAWLQGLLCRHTSLQLFLVTLVIGWELHAKALA